MGVHSGSPNAGTTENGPRRAALLDLISISASSWRMPGPTCSRARGCLDGVWNSEDQPPKGLSIAHLVDALGPALQSPFHNSLDRFQLTIVDHPAQRQHGLRDLLHVVHQE